MKKRNKKIVISILNVLLMMIFFVPISQMDFMYDFLRSSVKLPKGMEMPDLDSCRVILMTDGEKKRYRYVKSVKALVKDNKSIDFEEVNGDLVPILLERYNVTRLPAVVAVSGRGFLVDYKTDITNTIDLLLRLFQYKRVAAGLVFSETLAKKNDSEKKGVGLWKEMMAQKGIQYSVFSSTDMKEQLWENDVVVLIDPSKMWGAKEKKSLDRFLKKGGLWILICEPSHYLVVNDLLKTYNMKISKDYIRERNPDNYSEHETVVFSSKHSNSIRTFLKKEPRFMFPLCAACSWDSLSKTVPLVSTSSDAYLISSGKEINGAFVIGLSRQIGKGTLVVFGDSDFIRNDNILYKDNKDLASFLISKMVPEKNRYNMKKKIEIPLNNERVLLILGVLFMVPLILFSMAFGVVLKNRRKKNT